VTDLDNLDLSTAVKVFIDIVDGPFTVPIEERGGCTGEWPWAIPEGDLHRLVNPPLVDGLDWGDLVRCEDKSADGFDFLEVVELIERVY
jgi:hypothetical protein